MGLSSITDFITGRSLRHGEPVVAIALVRMSGGWPDAMAAAARPAIGTDHMFQAMSLPIRATAGDYGDIDPLPDQVAVALLLETTGFADWKQCAETAFDWQKGYGEGEEKTVLGWAVLSEASFDAVTKLTGNYFSEGDVDLVHRAVAQAQARMAADKSEQRWRNLPTLELKSRGLFEFDDGTSVELPELASALAGMHKSGNFAEPFVRKLRDVTGFALIDRNDIGSAKNFRVFLQGLQEHRKLVRGMEVLNRYFTPSSSGGQSDNAVRIALASVGNAVDAAGAILHRLEDQRMDGEGEREEKALEDILAALENAASAIRVRMAEIPHPVDDDEEDASGMAP